MRILHFGTLDTQAGGPAMSTSLTLRGLLDLGVDARLLSFPVERGHATLERGLNVEHLSSKPIMKKFAYSWELSRKLRQMGDFDIYHAQGVWQYPTYCMAAVARQRKRPYVITPRGMLYPQDIQKASTFFKKLSLKLRLLSDLNRAACVHVTCEEEMEHCRRLGVTSPIAVIPNPIELRAYPQKKVSSIRRIAYLGRLSPRKNVESLIYAFDQLRKFTRSAELVIIGGGDPVYEDFLKQKVNALGLNNVIFKGFLSGSEKDACLTTVDVLAMPSEFENFGNVILEGLARGIPCIATKGAPWEDLVSHNCGWWVDYSQAAITVAVENALVASDDFLSQMGEAGKLLVRNKYELSSVAKYLFSMYEWILGERGKPNFIYLN